MSAKTKKRKLKRSTDSSKCCEKCCHFNKTNPDCLLCSLDGKEVEKDGICKSFDSTYLVKCDRCRQEQKYKSREEYYNRVISFSFKNGAGSGSGQNIHLCSKCEMYAWEKFHEYLDLMREYGTKSPESGA